MQFQTISLQLSTISFFVCAFFAGLIPYPHIAEAEEIVPSAQASKLPGQDLQSKRVPKKAAIFKKVDDSSGPAVGETEKKEKRNFLSALLKKKDQIKPESDPVEEKMFSPEKNQTILAEAIRISEKEKEKKKPFIELVPSLKPVDLNHLEKMAQSPVTRAKQEKPAAEFLDLPTL
ncbi:MAG: hypothetical protein ABL994_06905 [Verrucomicrobiales bacterium]